MTPVDRAIIPCLASDGRKLVSIVLVPDMGPERLDALAPIVSVPEDVAAENGETEIQLRENGRYWYDIEQNDTSLEYRLRCKLARRRPNIKDGEGDSGRIETETFCGTLLLEIVEGDAGMADGPVLASAFVDVRSVKLEYRTEYRAMLHDLTDRIVDLVADARSSSKTQFRSNFEERSDKGWFQLQLELLREIVIGGQLGPILHRIFTYPHERLESRLEDWPTDRPHRPTAASLQTLLNSKNRQTLSETHPLARRHGIKSVAQRIQLGRNRPTLNTPENRFVKYALSDFRSFVSRAEVLFENAGGTWSGTAIVAKQMATVLDQWLSRPFFRDISTIDVVPLGSPVLHRKAGYREVFRWWLRFRTAAELSWKASEDLFRAGQRSVAELYEYWLFFHLLDWFCTKFDRDGQPPLIDNLLDGLDDEAPSLKLKSWIPLGPFLGVYSEPRRKLYAAFYYNREFMVTNSRREPGSWTRRMHPDYTFTFWPAITGLTPEESSAAAEEQELLVHIHLDAKYRVNDLEALFGKRGSKDADREALGNYKRQDLLKMHAYRDAIKRSEGAYIVYPGSEQPCVMRGFHEIIPGLGAFAVSPDKEGAPRGLETLSKFLDNILKNLCDRASLREQRSAHLYEPLRERRALYAAGDRNETGGLMLQEAAEVDRDNLRVASAADIIVLVGWFDSEAQKQWMLENGKVVLRLGRRRGALPIIKALSAASHILLHGRGYETVQGLFSILPQSGEVLSRLELAAVGYPLDEGKSADDIFAAFSVAKDPAFNFLTWEARLLETALLRFANRQRPELKRQLLSFRRERSKPQLVSLADLQIAVVTN